jgi:hypothetical protein
MHYMSSILEDDSPNISLKLTFDKINPELYTLMVLLSLLMVTTIIFLILHILNFIVVKSLWLYNYFNTNCDQELNNYDPLFN